MNNNQDSFKKHDSVWTTFHKSCLGRIVIFIVALLLLMLLSVALRPSEEATMLETRDNIHQLILDNDSTKQDNVDNTLASIAYIFSSADTVPTDTAMHTFDRLNHLEYVNHGLYTEVVLRNTIHVMGKCCSIGLWGMVIPVLTYEDLLLHMDVMRKEYNQKLIEAPKGGEDYFGSDPNLDQVFEDQY